MITRLLRLFNIILVLCFLGVGQLKADLLFAIEPVDSITRMPVRDAEVLAFLPGDSTVVAEAQTITHVVGLIERQIKELKLPQKNASYNIYVNAPGYEARFIPLHTAKSMEEYVLNELGEFGLLRTPKKLNEVTVTATKIKMYYKGDTIVYNADAFLLPDGSMLDELIRKLPGITLNRHGEIFSNGRKIESLQLEGRRLFDGSPRTLLENLGAYTVSKIKVYEQANRQADFLGYSDEERKPLIMDVNLKKEYSIGKWVNVDAGYGTDNRYLGRGFMLGFTSKFAMSAYVNANNISAESNPGRGEFWSIDKVGASESSYLSGGLSYQYDGNGGKRIMSGNLSVNTSDVTRRDSEERTNFLTTGNTYESRFNTQRSKSFSLHTNHSLTFESGRIWLELKPQFGFSRNSSDGSNIAGAFNDNPGEISAAEIEAVFTGSEEKLRECLINRELRRNKYNSSNIGGSINSLAVIKLPDANKFLHNVTFTLGGNYNSSTHHNYSRYSINYGADNVPDIGEYAYTRGHPAYNANINGSAKYEMNFKGRHTVSIRYAYSHDLARNTTSRYLLSDLREATLESLKFGEQPPEDLLSDILDPVNSNYSDYWSNEHTIKINSQFRWGNRNIDDERGFGMIYLFINPSLRILDRHYDYHRVNYDTLAVYRSALPQIYARLNYGADKDHDKYHYFASLGWDSNPGLFAMDNLINVANTSNPLDIFRGNSDLRASYNHRASVEFQFSKSKGLWQRHNITFSYSFTTDAIVRGVAYNPVTGIRIRSMYNVDGNRTYHVNYNGNGGIKKWTDMALRSLDYNVMLTAYDNRSVNIIGSNNLQPVQSYVYIRGIAPGAGMTLTFGADHNIKFSFNSNINRYSGENIDAFNSANLSYRLDATFRLPANIVLSSNLTLYCRRGYADAALNTDEYIWNASASWHWKKANLTFALDGYDLLHQIKAVSQYVDALGRTESWSNTLPRYAMIRVRYHINLSPK